MKQFVDMQALGEQIDKAGFELNDNFAVDVEELYLRTLWCQKLLPKDLLSCCDQHRGRESRMA
jgi:hypothetical protein